MILTTETQTPGQEASPAPAKADVAALDLDLLVLATFHKPYAYNAASPWLRPITVGSFRLDAPGVFCDATGEDHI